jgi:hypothetical protein
MRKVVSFAVCCTLLMLWIVRPDVQDEAQSRIAGMVMTVRQLRDAIWQVRDAFQQIDRTLKLD